MSKMMVPGISLGLEWNEDGSMVTNENYKEILVLRDMLVKAGIPHECRPLMDGWQIIYPNDGQGRVMDAIEHHGSYGKDEDLLEIMGLLTPEEQENDSVKGYLTANEVFDRIEAHYFAKEV